MSPSCPGALPRARHTGRPGDRRGSRPVRPVRAPRPRGAMRLPASPTASAAAPREQRTGRPAQLGGGFQVWRLDRGEQSSLALVDVKPQATPAARGVSSKGTQVRGAQGSEGGSAGAPSECGWGPWGPSASSSVVKAKNVGRGPRCADVSETMPSVCLAISQQAPPSQEGCWVVTALEQPADHPSQGEGSVRPGDGGGVGVQPTLGLERTPRLREFPWSFPPGSWPQSRGSRCPPCLSVCPFLPVKGRP